MLLMLISIASLGLALLLSPFATLVGGIAVNALTGRWRSRRLGAAAAKPDKRFALVIPAHNEAELIVSVLQDLKKVDYPTDLYRIVVIADNCSDHTADLARAQGVEVRERFNTELRGKGHALAETIDALLVEANALDAVVVLDADTYVDRQLLRIFAAGLASGYEWMQGYYNGSNPEASVKTGLMSLALALFNGVWMAGIEGLGLSVPLRGNGMCFATSGLRRHPWRTSGLAEDLEFSWTLRFAGERVHYVAAARVYGELVSSDPKAAASQRLRWEHGRKILRRMYLGQLLRVDLPGVRKCLYLIDLFMPPIGPLAAFVVANTLLSGGLVLASGLTLAKVALVWALVQLAVVMAYLLCPLVLGYLPLRRYLYLVELPKYLLWKLVLRFRKRPTAWVRTPRSV